MQNELKDLRELKKKFKKAVLSRKQTIDELRLAYDDILYSPYVPNNVVLSEIKLRGVDTDVLKPEMADSICSWRLFYQRHKKSLPLFLCRACS